MVSVLRQKRLLRLGKPNIHAVPHNVTLEI